MLAAGWLLYACGDQARLDTRRVREGMNERKIKRITAAELQEAAFEYGDTAATLLAAALNQTPTTATSCTPAFNTVNDSLYKLYGTFGYRVKLSAPPSALKELKWDQVWDSYRGNFPNWAEAPANVQKANGDTAFLYTKPLVFEANACGNCHKQQDERYLWAITMSRRSIVNNFGFR